MELDFGVNRFNSFFALSPEMMALLSPEGRFLEVNPAWEKCLGFGPRELKDTLFFELLDPQDHAFAQAQIQKLAQGEKTATFEARCRRKSRPTLWVEWTFNRPSPGEVFCLIGRDITELKATRDELEGTREKFRRLAGSANEGVALHDKGVILEANDALARMFGFGKAEDMVGKNGFDLCAPEYHPLVLRNIQSDIEEPYEVVALRKDGSRFNCLQSGKNFLYHGRSVRVSTFLDITKMKAREQELFESQELFRKLTEASKDGIAVSEKGKILLANPALARMLGTSLSELIGRNAVEFTAPEFREVLLKKISDEVETAYETMALRKDGTRFPVEVTPRMTSYQGRKVRVAFFRDITQRKKIEEEAQQQRDFSQSLINSSMDGLLAFDPECRYTLWNPAMERISGHSRQEVMGRCAFDVFPFLKQIGEDHYFYEALAGRTASSQERPYRTPAGREGFFEAHYMPLKNFHGEILGGLGIIHDITERKRAEEALRVSATDLKSVFHNTFQNIILLDLQGRIRTFNSNAAVAIKGNSGLDLQKGRSLTDYVQPGHHGMVEKYLAKARKGKVTHAEGPYLMKDGQEHWFEVKYHPVFGEKGEIEGICLTSLDIDDRKKGEEALRKSEADLRAVFNGSLRGFVLVGPDERIRDFNQVAQEEMRRTRGRELEAGRSLADYVEPEQVGAFRERFRRVLKGEILHIERPVKLPSGAEEWFEFIYNPVSDIDGRVIGVCLAVDSIDERKKAAEALKRSESNLRAIFNSSSQGIMVLDRDGRIQYFNQAAFSFVREGMGKDLEIGKVFDDYIIPEAKKAVREKLQLVLRGEVVQGENRYRFLDGSLRWYEYDYHPVLGEDGGISGICLTSLSIDERKQAEEALRESEEKFRKVFEEASVGITLVDKEFRFLHVNQAFCRMLGYTQEEMRGFTFGDITYPEDLPQNLDRMREVPKSGGFRMQKRYLHKDGRVLWTSLVVSAIYNPQGEVMYTMGIIENITERKAAEEALRESEEKFRKIFEDASIGMTLVGPDLKFANVNRAFCEMLGYPMGELVGKSFRDITHPEDLSPGLSYPPGAPAAASFQRQKRYLHKDGRTVWANLSVTSFLDEKGGLLYRLGMVEDVTEQKKVEEALRQSEADLKAVFNSGSQVTVLLRRDGNIQGFNKSAEVMAQRIMGIKLEKDRPFLSTLPTGANPELYRQSFQAALEGHETLGERAIRSADGKERWVEVKYQPVKNDRGGVDGVCFSLSFIDDRKKAEEALRRSESNLRAVFNSGPQAIFLLDLEGRLQAINKAAEEEGRRTALRVAQVGQPFLDYVPEGSRRIFLENFEKASRGQATKGERYYVGADGVKRWVEASYQPVFNDQGEVEGVCFVSTSIDERKRSEETLRESQERFERLAQVTTEGILIHDNPKVVDVNPTLASMLGYRQEEMIGKSGFDLLAPESREPARQKMAEGSDQPYEVLALRKDGSTFPVELQGSNYQHKGRELRVMSVRDISWRKEAERTLRDSEARYRRLVEVTPMALLVHRAGKILYLNPEGLKLLGAKSLEDIAGKAVLDIVHPDYRELVASRIRRATEKGVMNETMEQQLVRLDGRVIDVQVTGIPFPYEGDGSRLALIQDITESKKIQDMLLRYERLAAVGKVIAGIAHEIRNPLAVVSGMTQLLRTKLGAGYSQEMDTILDQTNRLKLFMDDILDFSREMKVLLAEIPVRPFLEKALALAQAQVGPSHTGVTVHWEFGEGLPPLWADPQRLEQVMVNLVTNAYQAMDGKGRLTLSAKTEGSWMKLGVGDEGSGIREADVPKLFEPFFTTKAHGSGLGLSISQKIAEAHGGTIQVISLKPHGTLFTLWLPLPKAAAQA